MDRSRQTLREVTSTHHLTFNTSQDGCEEAGAPEAYNLASLVRQDSGFGDVWKQRFEGSYHPQPLDKALLHSGPAAPTTGSDVKLLGDVSPQRITQSETVPEPSQRGSRRELGIDVSVDSGRPGSINTCSSHLSTTVTSFLPSSNTSSRKSSVTSRDKESNTAAAHRTVSTRYGRACTEDALAFYRQSVELFSPSSNTPNPPPTLGLASRGHTSATIIPVSHTSRHRQTASQQSIDQTDLETLWQGPYEYENFVPASSIDWTYPSTRQREYKKIDKSCRGLRGLWRRLTPRWCHGKRRHLDFFREGDKRCDTGSVRRYRIDTGGKEDKSKCGIREEEEEFETNLESCLNKARRLGRYLSPSKDKTTTPVPVQAPVGGCEVPEGKEEQEFDERVRMHIPTLTAATEGRFPPRADIIET